MKLKLALSETVPGRFWAVRSGREKALMGGLAAVTLAYALLAGLWLPATRHRDAMLDDIARYTRMSRSLADLAAQGVPLAAPVSDAPLPSVLAAEAAAYHLTIRRLQPLADTTEVALEDAAFGDVLIWLEALERDHGLRVLALTLTRRPEPGLVSSTLTVGR